MSKPIIFPDGSKCYTGVGCKKHAYLFKQLSTKTQPNIDSKVSRTMSFLLRHHPEQAHLVVDEEGYVDIDDFVEKINLHVLPDTKITRSQVERIVTADDKQRYSIVDNKVRAVQGHSFSVDLKLTPKTPPTVLFHGTNADAAKIIRKEGLKPMSREYVHLSPNEDTAVNVGQRRKGVLVILKIDTVGASEAGVEFYESQNGVWLVKELPAKFVK